jgi:hypothetical protein
MRYPSHICAGTDHRCLRPIARSRPPSSNPAIITQDSLVRERQDSLVRERQDSLAIV